MTVPACLVGEEDPTLVASDGDTETQLTVRRRAARPERRQYPATVRHVLRACGRGGD
jgi:hypothetical protein